MALEGFNLREEQASGQLLAVMNTITQEWRLNCNQDELTHAVHTIQMFIIKHYLQRLGADGFSDWYDPHGRLCLECQMPWHNCLCSHG